MKHLTKIIVLLALLVALLPVSAIFAQGGETPIGRGVVDTRGGTGVYAEASINSEIVASLEPGAAVMVYEEEGLWVRTELGWILASNLTIGPAPVNLQGVASTRSNFAIRAEPSLSAEVVTTLPSGSVVGVMELTELWAKVYDGEHIGYAFVADLELSEPTSQLTDVVQRAATTATRNETAVRAEPNLSAEVTAAVPTGSTGKVYAFSDNGLFAFVALDDGNSGWIFTSDLEIAPKIYGFGTLNAGPVNFRDAPDGTVLNVLSFGSSLELLGQSADGAWINVTYQGSIFIGGESVDNPTGWVSSRYVDSETDLSTLPVTE
jgi:uncharacterized protein YgiM (DUF1202 family)